ncbi:MAG: hypothetical protein GF405_10360 [Candidatus Eisenbacteria bacterium]|nr:hypothetical protein [Candidatus Eisenbacteria bacterium]
MQSPPRIERFLDTTEFLGVVVLFGGLAHSEALKSTGLLLAVAALAARLALGYRPGWLRRPAIWAVGLIVITSALSVAFADAGLRRPQELLTVAAMVSLFPLGTDVCTSRRRVVVLGAALLIGTSAGIAVSLWSPGLREGRFGLPSLPNPIVAGEYLAGVLPVAAALAMSRGVGRPGRALAWLVAAFSVTALWLTQSRGPLPAAALGLAVLLSCHARRFWVAAAVLVPAVVVAVSLSVAIPSSRLIGTRLERAIRIRSGIWSQTIDRIAERPITGHGVGTYGSLKVGVSDGAGHRYTSHAHSVALHLLAERGVLGLAAFLLFCALSLRDVAAAVRAAHPRDLYPAAACLAGAVALLIAGLSHLTVWAEPGFLFYGMLGIGTCALGSGRKL